MPRLFRFHSLSTRFFCSPVALSIAVSLASSVFSPPEIGRADEFSVLPPGDPIAVQLAVIAAGPAPVSLTRFEAALQTARVILDVQSRDADAVSRAQWRAIATLSEALEKELRQLGVDADAARAVANRRLKSTSPKASKTETSQVAPTLPRPASPPNPARRDPSFLGPPLVRRAAPSQNSNAAQSLQPGLNPKTALSYDLGRYLTLRAASSRLQWNGAGESPLLGAPIFADAEGASGAGGGLDVNLGAGLKFSTEVERLRADTGAKANRIGGAASLSAWQDRLLLNMSLSRLLPGDKTELPSTAAEVGASVDFSSRLSLNLSYQGLFAPTPSTSASRVAGGVSLKF